MSLPRTVATLVAAATVLALAATPATAHVEPTVTEVAAGSDAEVEFVAEHDCDGSPTVRVDIQSPESVPSPAPVDKPGWMSSVDGRVVTYEWEGVGGDEAEGFAVRFTVPDVPGETLLFPTVQTCAEGSIDWIQTEADGDRPAPRVVVTGSTDTPTTDPDTTEAEPSETTEPGDDADSTTTTLPPAPADGDVEDGSNADVYVVLAVVVLLVAGGIGGAVYLRRRNQG